MMKESVVIGDQIATRGTVVKVKSCGSVGMIQQIGRCGLVLLNIPALNRVFAPAELTVIRKEDDEEDAS